MNISKNGIRDMGQVVGQPKGRRTTTEIFFFPNEKFLLYRNGLSSLNDSSASMPISRLIIFLCIISILSLCPSPVSGSDFRFPLPLFRQTDQKFEQKTDRFWEFNQQSNSWVEVDLPCDLLSCLDDNCTKVGSIDHRAHQEEEEESLMRESDVPKPKENPRLVLPQRRRISLIKMSETSIWVTGESGSIYERFWNGLQWVIAPHELPVSAGYAVSVFIVNQTILALSEAGKLYQMKLKEDMQPIWVDFVPTFSSHGTMKEIEQDSSILLKSGVIAHDRERIYFCTKNGSLLELFEVEPPRWVNHGRPPGANVAAIVDAASVRPVVFTVSSRGDLYEYDMNSKPSWKMHRWGEGLAKDSSLAPSMGCSLQGLNGALSVSLFLLAKGGNLIERRLQQRKWKWIVHRSPEDHHLTSITPVSQDEKNEKSHSLFLTTAAGSVFEYRISKNSGSAQEENWVNHMHPPQAQAARGISGLQFQVGRILFPLNDGRLGELHLSGLGGESSGPTNQVTSRRKASLKYVWSILDAPETEGWNAEYCIEEHGPSNCILGLKDESIDTETARSVLRRRKEQQSYLTPDESKSMEEYDTKDNWMITNFRLRVMHNGRSFFLITNGGLTFEYLNAENMWFWIPHEHSVSMKGALGQYNGSLFLVDENGSLLIRERNTDELQWINCTAMRKGRQVIGGPPWDGVPGKTQKVTAEDALFFVSKSGRLLQFTVALRKFKWKDCRNPPNVKVASIIDKEGFRENIVFVVGVNGRLYQYNKVMELWHEHLQSQHLVLSRVPGTAMRPSSSSLMGSIFMISKDGVLVEYHWNSLEGWTWVEHGTMYTTVTFVGSPGPCHGGNQLFLIGSDGKVYLRYLNEETWKWKDLGFPHMGNNIGEKEGVCTDEEFTASFEENLEAIHEDCNPKVSSTRPIPFAEDSVVFELRDGRLAEMRQIEETDWTWSRTIGTPMSPCMANYWTALAS